MLFFGCMIKVLVWEFCYFGVIFGLVFVGFLYLCFLVFLSEFYKFYMFVIIVEIFISVMFGKFSYVNFEWINRVFGLFMFFFYSIGVVFIFINMFFFIIIENFKKVKYDNDF